MHNNTKLHIKQMGWGKQASDIFEKYLNRLFAASKLEPHASYKVVGQQIDGSFKFENNIFLLEATWQQNRDREKTLLGFYGL